MSDALYSTRRWKAARLRALERDAGHCRVRDLIGGRCGGSVHVHHLARPEDGGAPYALSNLICVCAVHHPKLEAVRRAVLAARDRERVRCPHRHLTIDARLLCEARAARRRSSVAA